VDAKHLTFPGSGQGLGVWDRLSPEDAGLDVGVIGAIDRFVEANPNAHPRCSPRWGLWRCGRLIHASVEDDDGFVETIDVASLRKTWHAMMVGAAVHQERIPSIDQPIGEWIEVEERFASVTWRHVMMQTAGLDYPYGEYPSYEPGKMWTYSDLNLVVLCNALARVYGREDFYDDYASCASAAYFDAIGMEGWSTKIVFDKASQIDDGVRFVISLDHMGRLGLFALARGCWNGERLVPEGYVETLETKQTSGLCVNYEGPNDGIVHLKDFANQFPECPYGLLSWTNSDGDYFPGADSGWAWGAGAGGTYIVWNAKLGFVFAAAGIEMDPDRNGIPHLIERALGVQSKDSEIVK
jgi:CubicO group peptidase (beta-lactamase class C family)